MVKKPAHFIKYPDVVNTIYWSISIIILEIIEAPASTKGNVSSAAPRPVVFGLQVIIESRALAL